MTDARPSANDARTWAAGAHLSAFLMFVGVPNFVGPLVVWLLKRDDDPFVEEHAREALNFNLSVFLYAVVGFVGGFLLVFTIVGIPLAVVLWILVVVLGLVWLVLVIVATVAALNGEMYRYPLTIRFIQPPSTTATGPGDTTTG